MKPAQKRRLGCWWAVLIPCLLAGLFVVQLIGPSPGVRVGPDTTRLTEPLRSDGLPDYQTRWLELLGPVPAPEENAAVLICRAIWPGELSPEQYELVCEALQMEEPAAHDALIPLQDGDLRRDLCRHLRVDEGAAHEIDELLERAILVPWESQQLPPLADWVKENQRPLDWLVAGAERPHFFAPSPSLLDGEDEMVIEMLLPLTHSLRLASKALAVRAMGRLANGETEAAWSDLLAIHRLARFAARGHTLVEQLVGIGIENMACSATQTFLHHGNLRLPQATRVRDGLQSLPPVAQMGRALDVGERFAFLDAVTRIGSGRFEAEKFQLLPNGDAFIHVLLKTRIDWNIALEVGNGWYDRLAEAFERPHEQRAKALAEVDRDLEAMLTGIRSRMSRGLLSTKARSQLAADYLMAVFLPSVTSATQAADRVDARLLLTRTAADLAVHRARTGSYPDALTELEGEVPSDPFAGLPLHYQSMEDGYLLYSVDQDGVDHGGTDATGELVRGQWADPPVAVTAGATDLVVRVPRRGLSHYFPAPTTRSTADGEYAVEGDERAAFGE